MIEAVIFDMDGVLVDTEIAKFKTSQQILKELGKDFSLADYRKMIGTNAQEFWHSLKEEFHLQESLKTIYPKWMQLYLPELEKIPLKPGVVEALKKARAKGLKLALASSSDMRQINIVLKKLGEEFFQAIVSGEHFTHAKPSPEIFLVAAEKLGVKPENCLVVEDSPAGITAAKAAGMACVAVKTNYFSAEEAGKADFLVESLQDFDWEKVCRRLHGEKNFRH